MKTLKESILRRSNHSGENFKAQRRNEIEDWLKEYNIKNYTINDDFTIDVDGDVDIYTMNPKEFPEYIQFGIVKGDFGCIRNNLKSLKGAPREVGKSFYCSMNELTSLEGAPEKVGEDFDCNHNNLTSLEGAPKRVRRSFNCDHNKLTSLEGAPKEIGRSFYCSCNQLTTLEGAPKEVGGDFDCSGNSVQFTEKEVRRVCNVKGEIILNLEL